MVRKAIGLDCDNFYNIAVVGAAGTGKVKYNESINILRCRYLPFIRAPWSMAFQAILTQIDTQQPSMKPERTSMNLEDIDIQI